MHDNKEKNNPVKPKNKFSEYPKENTNTIHQQSEDELKDIRNEVPKYC